MYVEVSASQERKKKKKKKPNQNIEAPHFFNFHILKQMAGLLPMLIVNAS